MGDIRSSSLLAPLESPKNDPPAPSPVPTAAPPPPPPPPPAAVIEWGCFTGERRVDATARACMRAWGEMLLSPPPLPLLPLVVLGFDNPPPLPSPPPASLKRFPLGGKEEVAVEWIEWGRGETLPPTKSPGSGAPAARAARAAHILGDGTTARAALEAAAAAAAPPDAEVALLEGGEVRVSCLAVCWCGSSPLLVKACRSAMTSALSSAISAALPSGERPF